MLGVPWAVHAACKHASTAVRGLLAHSRHHHLGRTCTRLAADTFYSSVSDQDDRSDDVGSKPRNEADPASGPTLPPPPPRWHQRGTWIDPETIEKRMMNDEEDPAVAKEPETDVGKSISAIIRVSLWTAWFGTCSCSSLTTPPQHFIFFESMTSLPRGVGRRLPWSPCTTRRCAPDPYPACSTEGGPYQSQSTCGKSCRIHWVASMPLTAAPQLAAEGTSSHPQRSRCCLRRCGPTATQSILTGCSLATARKPRRATPTVNCTTFDSPCLRPACGRSDQLQASQHADRVTSLLPHRHVTRRPTNTPAVLQLRLEAVHLPVLAVGRLPEGGCMPIQSELGM